ncbi:unnamed protein product [Angiostrongylus costaricensis]|uniref:Leishmanolysin-like peptidase n=1 Tax=Angiostrongylus costaricensis TaxID=334426 RepID=A0A158PFA2_ANGCS|nr:unnamed protein product [Angiostrongylus costaricensis]
MFTGIHYVFVLITPILTCEYKAPSKEDVTYAIAEYPEGHRQKREPRSWDWMRIETEYDPTFNILDEEKKEVLEDMITSARDYFESTLKVQRLGSIQLRPACIGEGTVDLNNTYQCSVDCEKRCGGALASVDAPYFAHCSCKYGPCPSMQRNWGGKLRNADFVLFVSVKEQSCGPLTLAFASHCALDQHTQRPIAGHVNICLSAFKSFKAHEISLWEATIKHELIHAFVFSPSLFPLFKGAGEVIKCSANRLAKVRCNLVEDMKAVPDEYDYNIPNLYKNRKGKTVTGHGQVEAGDFCPYYRTYGGVSREDSDTRCTFPGNMNYNNYSLEVFSPTARCFHLEDGIKVKSERGTVKWMHSVGCYETVCKDNRLHIKTQNSKFYPCYQGGQLIHVKKRVHGVGTVTTKIVCPSCTELCGTQYCAPDKNFNGRVGDPTREAIPYHPKFIIMFLVVLTLH